MTINAGHVENAPTLAQPGSSLFRYVAKIDAVEYEKCTSSPHFAIWLLLEHDICLSLPSCLFTMCVYVYCVWFLSPENPTRGQLLPVLSLYSSIKQSWSRCVNVQQDIWLKLYMNIRKHLLGC